MAVTILIHTGSSSPDEPPLSVTVDAPRVVIGRSAKAEVLLLDASVAKRHATLRQEGGRTLVADEGSVNGILVGGVKLPAHAPRVVAAGDAVRVGRVWLEVRPGGGVASTAAHVRGVALEALRRGLRASGEGVDASLELVSGPGASDAGKRHALSRGDEPYVLGRGDACEVVLDDAACSRSHATVEKRGDRWFVRDLGSKRGTVLVPSSAPPSSPRPRASEVLVGPEGAPLTDGDHIVIGESRLVFRDPLDEAMAEALASEEVRMQRDEVFERPPFANANDAPGVVTSPSEAPTRDALPSDPSELLESFPPAGAGRTEGALDTLVVLVALGVIALSAVGLVWLLR